MGKNTVREHSLMEKENGKEKSMWGNSRMDIEMAKDHTLGLVMRSMKGNSRMDIEMVREHTLGLMEKSI